MGAVLPGEETDGGRGRFGEDNGIDVLTFSNPDADGDTELIGRHIDAERAILGLARYGFELDVGLGVGLGGGRQGEQ